MQRILAVALLLGLLASTAGCGDDPDSKDTEAKQGDASAASLEGTRWRLETITEGTKKSSAPRGRATISFKKAGEVGVDSYCNVGGGDVKIGDGTMEFGAIMMTMRACTEPARARAEASLSAVLAGSTTFEVDGDRLTITKGDKALGFSAD